MKEKGMSKGEFMSVAQVNGGIENMINWDGKDQDTLALIRYIADEDKLKKILENPFVIKTPVVRNGKQSTLGYQPEVWKKWQQAKWEGSKLAGLNFANELENLEYSYSTDVMTGGSDKKMYLYYQLISSLKRADSVDIIVSF